MTYRSSKETRDLAWRYLKTSYWNIFLNLILIGIVAGLITIFTFGIGIIIFAGSIGIGVIITSLKIVRKDYNEEVDIIFDGFKNNLKRNIGLGALAILKIFLWTLLFVIPGIIKAIAYSQIFYIAKDHPELQAQEILKKSEDMMMNNKMRYFILGLSFIGWHILGIITMGIGFLFLAPYFVQTQAVFYEELLDVQGLRSKTKDFDDI